MDDSAKTEGEAAADAMKVSPEPSRAERRAALLHTFAHAHEHNAPVTPQMLKDLRTELHDDVPAADDPSKLGSG